MKIISILKAMFVATFTATISGKLLGSVMRGYSQKILVNENIAFRNNIISDLRVEFPQYESTLKVLSSLNDERQLSDSMRSTKHFMHTILEIPCEIIIPDEDKAYEHFGDCASFGLVRTQLSRIDNNQDKPLTLIDHHWMNLLEASRNSTFSNKLQPCESKPLSLAYQKKYNQYLKERSTPLLYMANVKDLNLICIVIWIGILASAASQAMNSSPKSTGVVRYKPRKIPIEELDIARQVFLQKQIHRR